MLVLGAETEFFGVPGAAEHGLALRTLAQAVALRHQILRCFELAEQAPDADVQRQLLTFVIVGGGPAGVEFAGALAELVHVRLQAVVSSLSAEGVHVFGRTFTGFSARAI